MTPMPIPFSTVYTREISYPVSYRHLSTHTRGGTEAISASTHLRSYRKGYSERREEAGKSCR